MQHNRADIRETIHYDSYANRIGKGTLNALKRFNYFKRKASKNNKRVCFVLKADVKHYFDEVDHQVLLGIIRTKIKDEKILWLIKKILNNFNTKTECKGMPLGNLTSQFFANIYLNELDQFVKNELKAKYYIRYVDDFVILENKKETLVEYKKKIDEFLRMLKIELHPDKSKIIKLKQGIPFLGFRIFYNYGLMKKSNMRKMRRRIKTLKKSYDQKKTDYDETYTVIEGWFNYAKTASSYKLRKKFIRDFEKQFPNQIAGIEIDRWMK